MGDSLSYLILSWFDTVLEIAEIDSVFLTHKNRLKAVPLD